MHTRRIESVLTRLKEFDDPIFASFVLPSYELSDAHFQGSREILCIQREYTELGMTRTVDEVKCSDGVECCNGLTLEDVNGESPNF